MMPMTRDIVSYALKSHERYLISIAEGALTMLVIVADDRVLSRGWDASSAPGTRYGDRGSGAGDFGQALSLVNQCNSLADLLLLDLGIPGMDWRQALEELGEYFGIRVGCRGVCNR